MILGCSGEESMTNAKQKKIELLTINDIPDNTWHELAKKKIYFGHQSVGNNIIDGITKVMASNSHIKLNIKDTNKLESFAEPIFAHSDVGKNEFPDSKVLDFRKNLENGIGENVDIAFVKYCFWDIRRNTDINAVFDNYKNTLSDLKKQFPNIQFIHLTVPLMSHSTGIKSRIKRTLGMQINSDLDNIKRNQLNDLILLEYNGKEPIFDIALLESTLPDGTRQTFSSNDNNYNYLLSEYTYDGGHLSEEARIRIAEQLLITLANVIDQ